MKRFVCCLLALALLGGLSAYADVDDWDPFDSVFGFSMLYPSWMLDEYGIPAEDAGVDTECFVPSEEDPGVKFLCQEVRDPNWPDWEGRGYRKLAVDEPSVEMDVAMDMRYRLYQSEDGKETVEEIRLAAAMEDLEYVFTLIFPTKDEDDWRGILEGMLETVEFPPQGAAAGSFRLDFFRDDLAGLQYTDVILDEEAATLVLFARTDITDFALEKLTWDDDTFTVSGAEPLYEATVFPLGSALRITCWFSDILPELRVRCVNENGEEECWYLFLSERDGSLLLLGENQV